jgi:hypothetical protein
MKQRKVKETDIAAALVETVRTRICIVVHELVTLPAAARRVGLAELESVLQASLAGLAKLDRSNT